jgi:chemotaxis protein methyltransferase CheR
MQRYRILATDISTKILAVAQRAVYPAERLDPAPPGWRTKYFDDGGNGLLQLKPAVRRMVQFQRLNLVETFHAPRQFPLIFCRNVMIYFDPPTQERLVTGLARYIRPGGYLFVGHSESLGGLKQPLKYERPAIYRKA